MKIIIRATTDENKALYCEAGPDFIGVKTEAVHKLKTSGFILFAYTKQIRKNLFKDFINEYDYLKWYRVIKKLKQIGLLETYRQNGKICYEVFILTKSSKKEIQSDDQRSKVHLQR